MVPDEGVPDEVVLDEAAALTPADPEAPAGCSYGSHEEDEDAEARFLEDVRQFGGGPPWGGDGGAGRDGGGGGGGGDVDWTASAHGGMSAL